MAPTRTNQSRAALAGSIAVVAIALGSLAGAQGDDAIVVNVKKRFECEDGAERIWTVPPTVSQVNVSLAGGQGGSGLTSGDNGGLGGSGTLTALAVEPGQTYRVIVGCQGEDRSQGGEGGAGFGNGGDGAGSASSPAGGGGGGSAFLDPAGNPLIVAGGGGGGTVQIGLYSTGGTGGGTAGGDGTGDTTVGTDHQGKGGIQAGPGQGGTRTGLGVLLCPAPCEPAPSGSGNDGGDGASLGGGGGGGWFGGGGGGVHRVDDTLSYIGGGGGGSGYIAPALSGSGGIVSGTQQGDGFVELTYDAQLGLQFTFAISIDVVAGVLHQTSRFDVKNTGGAPAENPELTVSVPSGSGVVFDLSKIDFGVEPSDAGWSCSGSGGTTVTCSGGATLEPGDTATFFLPYVAQESAPAGQVTMTAQFTSGEAVVTAMPTFRVIRQDESVTPPGGGTIDIEIDAPESDDPGGEVLEGCSITQAQPTTPEAVAGAGPAGVVFPYGLVDMTVTGCDDGQTVTFTITFPGPLPPGTQFWKYGPTPESPTTPVWYVLENAAIDGNTVTYTITDGELGDDDLTANGTIEDPGGPGVAQAVPSMPAWVLAVLAVLLAAAARFASRSRCCSTA